MDRKKFTFIVEVVYNNYFERQPEEGGALERGVEPAIYNQAFTSDKRKEALTQANKHISELLSDGLVGRGGSVLKSVIPASCLLKVGLIDLDDYEASAAKAEQFGDGYDKGYVDKVEGLAKDSEETSSIAQPESDPGQLSPN